MIKVIGSNSPFRAGNYSNPEKCRTMRFQSKSGAVPESGAGIAESGAVPESGAGIAESGAVPESGAGIAESGPGR